MQVDHWGLHWEGPYPFLVEPQGSLCLLEGHEGWTKEFKTPSITCPHRLISEAKHEVPAIDPSPFLAVPDTGAYSYLKDWRTFPISVEAFWATPPARLVRKLRETNLTPLCLIGYRWSDLDTIMNLLELPRPRPIIFLGDFVVPTTVEIEHQESFTVAQSYATLKKIINATSS